MSSRRNIQEHNAIHGREHNDPVDLTASHTPAQTSKEASVSEIVRRVLQQTIDSRPTMEPDEELQEDGEDSELSVYQVADMAAQMSDEELGDDSGPAEPKATEGNVEADSVEDPPDET